MITYNIYKNNELIKENAPVTVLKEIVGLNSGNVSKYFGLDKGYRAKDGSIYTYEHGLILDGHKNNKRKLSTKKTSQWTPKLIEQWNDRCAAAQGIQAGTHHIVSKYINGKWVRYTEAIG